MSQRLIILTTTIKEMLDNGHWKPEMLYKEKAFDFDETKDVFNLIVSLLKKAIKRGVNVKAERI